MRTAYSILRLPAALVLVGIGLCLVRSATAQNPVPGDTTAFELQPPENPIQPVPNPSQLLPRNLADRYTLDRLPSGVYQTQPDLIEQLSRDTSRPESAPDSVHVLTSQLPGGLERASLPSAPSAEGAPKDRSRFLLPQEALARRGGQVEGYYRPFIETLGNELALNSTNEGFEGRLFVGVWDTTRPAGRHSLPTPVQFQFGSTDAEVTPTKLTIDHTHVPLREIRISSDRVRDSVRLTILTSLSREGIPISLAVRRPRLHVDVTPSQSVAGFGLGTADLDVRIDRLSGEPVSAHLSARLGAPDPRTVTVTGTTPATARIRSSGRGTDTVTARAAGFRSDTAVVRYAFPWTFLIATTLGGLAGGGLRYLRGRSDEHEHPRLALQLGGGLLMALVVGVGSTVGVNVLAVEVDAQYGAAAFFFVAAVSAFLWEDLRLAWLGR